MSNSNKRGFTLLEVLLVVAIIAILAGIVILAINPNKQLGDTRNSQRRSDVNTILSATYQYLIENSTTSLGLPTTGIEICRTQADSCVGFLDLSQLTENEKYLTSFPIDPRALMANGTGYFINRTTNNRITVSAPYAENNVTITATR